LSNSGTGIAGDDEKTGFKIEWKDGFRFENPDKKFSLKFGGRLMNDWMWGSADSEVEDAFGSIVSGNEFRRARLYVSGTVYKVVEFKVQYDFAGGDVDFKDAWLGIKKLPFGSLRIGHFKEPFSLEELTSSKYITFMERSLPNIFAPGRNTGFGILGKTGNEQMTWGFGVFTDANDYGEAEEHDDTYNFSGRFTFLPWVEGDDLLHVGVGYHYQGVNEGDVLRYRQRPEVHLTHRFVDTGRFASDSANVFGLEAAMVYGQLSFQAEYMYNMVSADDYGDPNLSGGYVYGSFFLTPGDHRRYKKSAGAFDRVKPKNPYMGASGTGALELGLRYSWLDLTNAEIFGGELMDITLGLNWYINNVTRMMFNYIYADRDDVGSANFFQMRFQIDF
jgi:phosphate-selective porin OprO/OprP